MKTTLKFKFAKETKGTAQYKEVDPKHGSLVDTFAATIGTLYLRKDAMEGGTIPQELTVTVEY